MITKERIEELILDWIGANYGSNEAEDPCYNIEFLAEHLAESIKNIGRNDD